MRSAAAPAARQSPTCRMSCSSAGTCMWAAAISDPSSTICGWPAHATAGGFRTTCCCCRRRCGPSDVPAFAERVGRQADCAARSCAADRHRARERRARHVADLRAVDAQRQLGSGSPGRSRQRHSLHPAALRADRRRAAGRAAAAGRDCREGGVDIGCRRPSRRARWTAAVAASSGRRGCATCRCDRRRPLLPDGPLVVGADLNTWHGRDELAARFLGQLFRATPLSVDRQGLGLRVLDYMFFRAAPHQRARYRQVEQRYGSDHRPLVGWVE